MGAPDLKRTYYDNSNCDLVAQNGQDAIDELCARIGNSAGEIQEIDFYSNGVTADAYIALDGNFATSDVVEGVVLLKSDFFGITYNNEISNSKINIQVFKNGLVDPTNIIFEHEITAHRGLCKTDISPVICDPCDRITVYLENIMGTPQNQRPKDPHVKLLFRIRADAVLGEGTF